MTHTPAFPSVFKNVSAQDLEWYEDAACREWHETTHKRDIWYSNETRDIRQAKRICRDCPVRPACLAFAFKMGDNLGIWGGMTKEERKIWRKRQRSRREPLDKIA